MLLVAPDALGSQLAHVCLTLCLTALPHASSHLPPRWVRLSACPAANQQKARVAKTLRLVLRPSLPLCCVAVHGLEQSAVVSQGRWGGGGGGGGKGGEINMSLVVKQLVTARHVALSVSRRPESCSNTIGPSIACHSTQPAAGAALTRANDGPTDDDDDDVEEGKTTTPLTCYAAVHAKEHHCPGMVRVLWGLLLLPFPLLTLLQFVGWLL